MKLFIVCPVCKAKQDFHGQHYCDICHKAMSNWAIATQLLDSREKEFKEQLKEKSDANQNGSG
jgi:hypothetical protein